LARLTTLPPAGHGFGRLFSWYLTRAAGAGHSAAKLVSEKRDGGCRALLVDELLVRRLPAGTHELGIPVRYELVGIPLIPVFAPKRGETLFVAHAAQSARD
jgi:hypothetical protein